METSELRKYLLHIKRLGGYDKVGKQSYKFGCYTTCGYVAELEPSNGKKVVYSYFVYNGIGVAVSIPINKGCYQIFRADLVKHQTAIPLTFDGEYVRLNDPDLFIFAWGAGRSEKRRLLEEDILNLIT